MSRTLPRLRANLEFMPSPVPERPGLLIRDSYQYSDATLIIPPALVESLQCFDGRKTELDLRELLVRLTGDLRVGELEGHLVATLHEAGFLEDEVYQRMKEEREAAFAAAPRREPSHAGSAYPQDPDVLRDTLRRCLGGECPPGEHGLLGIAAPHVSLEGGWLCYQAAYRAMGAGYKDRTFVVLGTSHYGEPGRFGLTRKPFVTPLGEAATDAALSERLAREAGPAAEMEDYCHSVEHSIEFQVLFLQYLCGPGVKILPVLCGSLAPGHAENPDPARDPKVSRFLGALRELAAAEGERLFWVLGIDLAHMGRRYGDTFTARANEGLMERVAAQDRRRLERVSAGDAAGFWDLVRGEEDGLKWCGASALYTFLHAVPRARGTLLDYRQWNIDERSAVTFAALSFR